jgi:hypothetical protein
VKWPVVYNYNNSPSLIEDIVLVFCEPVLICIESRMNPTVAEESAALVKSEVGQQASLCRLLSLGDAGWWFIY